MENNRFDLIDLLQLLKSKAKIISIFTILGLIVSIIFVMIRKDVYTSETKLLVKSYMNFDRNQMFSQESQFAGEAFAKENEVDKAMTIFGSSDVIAQINETTQYGKIKNLSPIKAFRTIQDNFKIKRTDNSDIEVKFTDEDPKLALAAISVALAKGEEMYVDYFEDFNRDASEQIAFKQKLIADSTTQIIAKIAEIRKTNNIYNALAPVRGKVIMSTPSTLTPANAEAMEQLESLISIKDKLDEENGKFAALRSQYNSYLNEAKMHAFYKVGGPYESTIPSNIKAWIVVAGSVLAAFLFACFWVLISNALTRKA